MSIATLEGLIADLFMRDATLTGLTITGGEPLQQSAALTSLLRALKARWLAAGAEIDVLLFTGYALRAARARAAHVLDLADVVVAGPYRAHHGHGGGLLGSTNQELLVKSDLGRARLAALETAPSLQVTMVGTTLTMVGLPRPGDLDRLRSELEVVGIEMGSVSWQP